MTTRVQGYADEGWGALADAFRGNFELHRELGAACCVYVGGRPVVDLWGGVADPRTGGAWDSDTVVLVFSTTKGATAICAHMLAERGSLDLDAPVVQYWPEFGANGKDQTRVRWLLSHQAGLPGIDASLTLPEVCAWEPVIRQLEQQSPLWEPGTQQSYHGATWGYLIGEVVRRITGKTVGTFFSDEVAVPLNLSSWIGLPAREESRVAHLAVDADPLDLDHLLDAALVSAAKSTPVPEATRAALKKILSRPDDPSTRLGGAFPVGWVTEDGGHNTRLVRASEHPSSGMVTDARSLARMYAATIGDIDDVRLLRPETVREMTVPQQGPLHGIPAELGSFFAGAFPTTAMSLGFTRPSRMQPLLGSRSFGHPGFGGSLGFADPEFNVGFGYVANRVAPHTKSADNLVAAVSDCL